jgi:hypothetical protein
VQGDFESRENLEEEPKPTTSDMISNDIASESRCLQQTGVHLADSANFNSPRYCRFYYDN